MFSAFVHTVTCVSASCLSVAESFPRGGIIRFSIFQFVDFGCGEECCSEHPCPRFCADISFYFLGRGPTGRTAGSHDNSVPLFWGTAKLFHSVCTILHSHQPRTTVSASPHPQPALVNRLSFSSPWWVCGGSSLQIWFALPWRPVMWSIFLGGLLAVCVSPLEKCLFKSLAHF